MIGQHLNLNGSNSLILEQMSTPSHKRIQLDNLGIFNSIPKDSGHKNSKGYVPSVIASSVQYKAVQENIDLMVMYNKELKRILSLHE